MTEYKYYEDKDFDIADGPIIIDLNADIGGSRHSAIIECKDGSLQLEFDYEGSFGDIEELDSCDGPYHLDKLQRIRITALEDNSWYRIRGGHS